ncbi:polyprenol reductase-like [Penaeus japonicus]|uniref:polyprenol reductase-like n=1 Tax=Penaeus japonicus TaxID=27405 RepID=UPI001C713C3B|nr:polyprenol reductase-like [Penaeus japonicus]
MYYLWEALLNAAYEWNLCRLMFVFYIVVISLSGTVVNFLTSVIPVPDFFLQAFKFGKMAHNETNRFISLFEIPKRWFYHFYVVASVVVTAALVQVGLIYIKGNALPAWEKVLFDILTSPERKPAVTNTAAVIGLVLLALQIYRRLYENLFVSVFSSGHINILHYIVGHTHYLGAVVLLLAQAPGFDGQRFETSFASIGVHHIVGCILSLIGYVLQFVSLSTLASLRKSSGKAAKEKHMMPRGGMFDLLSCPHMLAEILVYVGVAVVLWNHTGWLFVTAWVISNQVQVAVMNHSWYRETFKDYPLKRKAIFPFLL